jgi:DNA-directed RNA polymerase subunit RPC12/RpoP
MNINKDSFALGETITGEITVASQDEFEADEIRVELVGNEKIRAGGEAIRGVSETPETRLYSTSRPQTQSGTMREYLMYRGQTKVSQKLTIGYGFNQQFSFKIAVPAGLGPTYQGLRRDGQYLDRTWTLKGIVAVGGRPDVETKRSIQVSTPSAPTPPPPIAAPVSASMPGVAAVPAMAEPVQMQAPQPAQPREMITSCTRCSAPINPSQEDLIVTCRYCGFTISMATAEEIKQHSMLENHLFTQQAVEAAQKYMDKGLFRSGVSRDAQITNVKLRYIPFWTFPVNTNTSFSGVTGTGLSGEMHQVEAALSDKRASKLSKFGKLVKAGASAYVEMQQKDRKPTTVSLSFSSYYVWPVLARKTMISEINYYDVPAAKKIPFDVGKITSDAEFLNTEYKEDEAKPRVKAEVEARERLLASGRVDNLQSCNTNVAVGSGELVHAPIWFVQYSLKGDNYVILVDGSEGKVLGGGRPLFKF